MKRSTFLYLQDVLYDYPDTDALIKENQNKLFFTNTDYKCINRLKLNKQAVEHSLMRVDETTKDIIATLYFNPRSNLTMIGVADNIHISERTLYTKRNLFFELLRKELGL